MSAARTVLSRARREEAGQALVLIALSLAGLLLGVGLAVDTGQLYVARRQLQNAADAAAWAGAVILYNNGGAVAAETAAIADAALNGYVLLPADVDSPPLTGPTAGDASFIEVRMTQQVTTFFFPGPRPVSVRAAAGSARSGTGEGVLVLLTGGVANTLETAADSYLTVTGSGIHVNSSSGSAVTIAGAAPPPASRVKITSPYTRVVGGVTNGDEAQIVAAPSEFYAGGALADPFLGLPNPPAVGGPFTQAEITAAVTLNPGVYNGGISVTTGGVATLNPGVYILKGGTNPGGCPAAGCGLRVRNGGVLQMASPTAGVLIFITHQNYPAAPGGAPVCNTVDLDPNGGAPVGSATLRAQTTGTYAGMVIYQDRGCPLGGTDFRIRNSGVRSVSGTVYIPNSRLLVRGQQTLNWTAQLVVRELRFEENNTRLNLTFDPGRVFGSRAPALTE